MNVVIYEPDLNPLTIISLPLILLEAGTKQGIVSLQVDQPMFAPLHPDLVTKLEVLEFALEFLPLRIGRNQGFCIIDRSKDLKSWLMPIEGQARTPREFLRNRDKLTIALRGVLQDGLKRSFKC